MSFKITGVELFAEFSCRLCLGDNIENLACDDDGLLCVTCSGCGSVTRLDGDGNFVRISSAEQIELSYLEDPSTWAEVQGGDCGS
jgi:hypothetical protein